MEPVAPEHEFREKALAALSEGDWYGAYQWAKGWIGGGGGAWIVDPWLIYAASALLNRQPRNATHSLDLALRHWIPHAADRAILLWARGTLILRFLSDPKTALPDLQSAAADAPAWLRSDAETGRDECLAAVPASRKRKPSVTPAPGYLGPSSMAEKVPDAQSVRVPGDKPPIWDDIHPMLIGSRIARPGPV